MKSVATLDPLCVHQIWSSNSTAMTHTPTCGHDESTQFALYASDIRAIAHTHTHTLFSRLMFNLMDRHRVSQPYTHAPSD